MTEEKYLYERSKLMLDIHASLKQNRHKGLVARMEKLDVIGQAERIIALRPSEKMDGRM